MAGEPPRIVQPEASDVAEVSPDGRYQRYHELVGSGAFKNVYKAYDSEEGIEVAWNQIKATVSTDAEKEKLWSEVTTLQKLRHNNILEFHQVK